jgi:hypothetical protein
MLSAGGFVAGGSSTVFGAETSALRDTTGPTTAGNFSALDFSAGTGGVCAADNPTLKRNPITNAKHLTRLT